MSRILRIVQLGGRSLRLHPLRSFLTALGIIIGVGAVIYMLAVVEGAARETQEKIRARGATNIMINAKKPVDDETAGSATSREINYGLTYEDARRINDTFDDVDVIVPVREVSSAVYSHEIKADTTALATVPWYLDVSNGKVDRGRWFSQVEFRAATPVTVLGANLARKLFLYKDPLNQTIRLGSNVYRVVGVLRPTVTSDEKEANKKDGAAFIPLSTVRERFGERNVKQSSGTMDIERVELHQVLVRVQEMDDVRPVWRGLEAMLKKFHRKEDYEIDVPLALLAEAEQEALKDKKMFGAIAGISLLVGGIGIMNIMLASVTERTREIGIRRALGAMRRFITYQFLTETLILSFIGGIIGIGIGVFCSWLHQFLGEGRTVVTPISVALSFGISAAVGILAGLYPAIRAARMDPIRALRHE